MMPRMSGMMLGLLLLMGGACKRAEAQNARERLPPRLICFGNEPSWSLELGPSSPTWLEQLGAEPVAVTLTPPQALSRSLWNLRGVDAKAERGFDVDIRQESCADIAAELRYPYSVRIEGLLDTDLQGCCRVPVHAGGTPPAEAALPRSWLDGGNLRWNVGARIPLAEPKQPLDSARCKAEIHPAATEEERLVEGAGWMLVGPVQRLGQTVLVTGTDGFDGMCRYAGAQAFAFSDGAFVGTLAPQPMMSRTDGALIHAQLTDEGQVTAGFARYSPQDPVCCPSRYSTVLYRIERLGATPFLIPDSVSTDHLPTE